MPDPQSTAEMSHDLPPPDLQEVREATSSSTNARAQIDRSANTIRECLEALHSFGIDPRCKASALTKLDECLMWIDRG